jgi:streptogramin lyase
LEVVLVEVARDLLAELGARDVGGPEVDPGPHARAPVHVAANSVVVIDPSSRRLLSAPVAVGGRPGPLAEADGSVWVANLDDNTITGIDATSRKRGATFTPGLPISGMTARGKSLWISGARGGLAKVDPTVQAVTKLPSISVYDPFTPQTADAPRPIAVGASSVWVGQPGAVTRLDSTGTRRGLIDGLDRVDAIAVGAGATWVSDTDNNVVAKIVDGAVEDRIQTGDGPGAIAVGDGAVWVAERFAGKVARIDPSNGRVITEIPVGAAPSAVALIGNSVWVANSADGTLSEIDARTNRVASPLRIGNTPAALAAVAGKLWVSVQASAAGVASPVSGPTGGVVRVAYEDDPGSLDPAAPAGNSAWQILNATCAKLYNYPDVSGAAGSRMIPEVARGMPAVSEDGLRYTFTIRPGFRFSPPSNAPVTAQTFRDDIERALSPRWGPLPQDPSVVPEIAGLGAFRGGRARHISGISASGNRLVIRLTRPAADLPQQLAMPYYCAVPGNAPVRARAPLPMAGPYYMHSYSPSKQIVLARNPNYRGDRPARPQAIDITIGASPGQGALPAPALVTPP